MSESEKIRNFIRINPGIGYSDIKSLINASKYIDEFNRDLPSTVFLRAKMSVLRAMGMLNCVGGKWFVIEE